MEDKAALGDVTDDEEDFGESLNDNGQEHFLRLPLQLNEARNLRKSWPGELLVYSDNERSSRASLQALPSNGRKGVEAQNASESSVKNSESIKRQADNGSQYGPSRTASATDATTLASGERKSTPTGVDTNGVHGTPAPAKMAATITITIVIVGVSIFVSYMGTLHRATDANAGTILGPRCQAESIDSRARTKITFETEELPSKLEMQHIFQDSYNRLAGCNELYQRMNLETDLLSVESNTIGDRLAVETEWSVLISCFPSCPDEPIYGVNLPGDDTDNCRQGSAISHRDHLIAMDEDLRQKVNNRILGGVLLGGSDMSSQDFTFIHLDGVEDALGGTPSPGHPIGDDDSVPEAVTDTLEPSPTMGDGSQENESPTSTKSRLPIRDTVEGEAAPDVPTASPTATDNASSDTSREAVPAVVSDSPEPSTAADDKSPVNRIPLPDSTVEIVGAPTHAGTEHSPGPDTVSSTAPQSGTSDLKDAVPAVVEDGPISSTSVGDTSETPIDTQRHIPIPDTTRKDVGAPTFQFGSSTDEPAVGGKFANTKDTVPVSVPKFSPAEDAVSQESLPGRVQGGIPVPDTSMEDVGAPTYEPSSDSSQTNAKSDMSADAEETVPVVVPDTSKASPAEDIGSRESESPGTVRSGIPVADTSSDLKDAVPAVAEDGPTSSPSVGDSSETPIDTQRHIPIPDTTRKDVGAPTFQFGSSTDEPAVGDKLTNIKDTVPVSVPRFSPAEDAVSQESLPGRVQGGIPVPDTSMEDVGAPTYEPSSDSSQTHAKIDMSADAEETVPVVVPDTSKASPAQDIGSRESESPGTVRSGIPVPDTSSDLKDAVPAVAEDGPISSPSVGDTSETPIDTQRHIPIPGTTRKDVGAPTFEFGSSTDEPAVGGKFTNTKDTVPVSVPRFSPAEDAVSQESLPGRVQGGIPVPDTSMEDVGAPTYEPSSDSSQTHAKIDMSADAEETVPVVVPDTSKASPAEDIGSRESESPGTVRSGIPVADTMRDVGAPTFDGTRSGSDITDSTNEGVVEETILEYNPSRTNSSSVPPIESADSSSCDKQCSHISGTSVWCTNGRYSCAASAPSASSTCGCCDGTFQSSWCRLASGSTSNETVASLCCGLL